MNYSVNVTNTLTRGNVVKNQFTCNDTSGNSIQSSDILWTVANIQLEWITEQIKTIRDSGRSLRDIAILYRSHFISRSYEEVFIKNDIKFFIIRLSTSSSLLLSYPPSSSAS